MWTVRRTGSVEKFGGLNEDLEGRGESGARAWGWRGGRVLMVVWMGVQK